MKLSGIFEVLFGRTYAVLFFGLATHTGMDTIRTMSASELLKHVKSLSPGKGGFRRAVRAMAEASSGRSGPTPGTSTGLTSKPARRVSGGRILPNLVLMERDEAAF